MPWEWKEEPPVPVQPVYYPRPYASISELSTLLWLVITSSIAVTVGFGLLVGSALVLIGNSYAGSAVYSSGYSIATWFGIALMVIGCIMSFVIGIIMLSKRWTPAVIAERGLVVATGVIAILGTLTIVGIILGAVFLSRLANYRRVLPTTLPPAPPISVV